MHLLVSFQCTHTLYSFLSSPSLSIVQAYVIQSLSSSHAAISYYSGHYSSQGHFSAIIIVYSPPIHVNRGIIWVICWQLGVGGWGMRVSSREIYMQGCILLNITHTPETRDPRWTFLVELSTLPITPCSPKNKDNDATRTSTSLSLGG